MNAIAIPAQQVPALVPRYACGVDPRSLLTPHTLAVFGFGAAAPTSLDDFRYLHIGLQPSDNEAWFEIWESPAPVRVYHDGLIGGAHNDEVAFGWIECVETEGGVEVAAHAAYQALLAQLAGSKFPHLLRVWNYLDAITEGEADAERYRQFCVGRAAGFAAHAERFPAATAIGRRDGRRVLQVYWLSAKAAGTPLENPRQMAAWRYPREYGPRSPSFVRAMLAPVKVSLPLMLSGTAAIIGHASQHVDNLPAQLDETMRNFSALIDAARVLQPELPAQFDGGSLLKVYLRDQQADFEALLDSHLPAEVPRLVVYADICRANLAIEIDGFHGC
ncbi:MAG: chorismate transformation enzyme, FkbO/Hyg5 family [Pseudomarimonas sp.]